jgi:hypothetical protein
MKTLTKLEYKTADPKTLEKLTKPIPLTMGVKPSTGMKPPGAEFSREMQEALTPIGQQPVAGFLAPPRTDLSGRRVKSPDRPEIYLVDKYGYRRWIPDPLTYNNLFRGWDGILIAIDIDSISLGAPITSGAVLAQAYGRAPIYLIDSGVKRWIVSPQIMDKYYFAWDHVYVVPPMIIDSIPIGDYIDR